MRMHKGWENRKMEFEQHDISAGVTTGWRTGSLSPFISSCRNLAKISGPSLTCSLIPAASHFHTAPAVQNRNGEMETGVLYGNAPQMPKHQGLDSNTPGKVCKINRTFVKHCSQGSWEARVLCLVLPSVFPGWVPLRVNGRPYLMLSRSS
jgi:hypothetical protein